MQSTFQFDDADNFQKLPQEAPKEGRHAKLVAEALALEGASNVFVDCSTSIGRNMKATSVCPCVTPTHPVYAAHLGRYLGASDFLQCQGMWPSTFEPGVREQLLAEPAFAQDLAGNGFSSTVCQVATLASMAASPSAWAAISGRESSAAACSASSQSDAAPAGLLKRRITTKRRAPAFDDCIVKEGPKKNKNNFSTRPHHQRYRRKEAGVDSRKKTSKGKKESASIWQKEQLKLWLGFSALAYICFSILGSLFHILTVIWQAHTDTYVR